MHDRRTPDAVFVENVTLFTCAARSRTSDYDFIANYFTGVIGFTLCSFLWLRKHHLCRDPLPTQSLGSIQTSEKFASWDGDSPHSPRLVEIPEVPEDASHVGVVSDRKSYGREAYGRNVSALFPFRSQGTGRCREISIPVTKNFDGEDRGYPNVPVFRP